MHTRPVVLALMYFLLGVLFSGIGIPLALGRVGPNAWYGFRTAKTFSSSRVWYAANRVAGIDLIIGGGIIAASAIVLFLIRQYVAPTLRTDFWTFIAFVATMVAIAGHGFWALSRM